MNLSAQPLPSGARTKAGGGCGAEPGDLLLEVAGHVLAPMVVADAEATASSFSTPPKRSATPCRIGSSVPWRVPWEAAWMPTHSAEQ